MSPREGLSCMFVSRNETLLIYGNQQQKWNTYGQAKKYTSHVCLEAVMWFKLIIRRSTWFPHSVGVVLGVPRRRGVCKEYLVLHSFDVNSWDGAKLVCRVLDARAVKNSQRHRLWQQRGQQVLDSNKTELSSTYQTHVSYIWREIICSVEQ